MDAKIGEAAAISAGCKVRINPITTEGIIPVHKSNNLNNPNDYFSHFAMVKSQIAVHFIEILSDRIQVVENCKDPSCLQYFFGDTNFVIGLLLISK